MICGIYSIRNKINNKRYIGSSVDIKKGRWPTHKKALREGNHHSIYLQRAWDKHGKENFIFEVIEEVLDETTLRKREGWWQKKYKTTDRQYGYNLQIVDENGAVRPSEESRRKMSEAQMGNQNFLGHNHSNEAKQKISAARVGCELSKEHKQKISDALTGIPRSPETRAKISASNMGKVMSPEAREKMSEAKKGSTPWNKGGSSWSKGRTFTEEHKAKIAAAQSALRVSAKTTPEQVEEIIQKYTSGEYSQRQLSEEYNLTQSGVSRLIKRALNKKTP